MKLTVNEFLTRYATSGLHRDGRPSPTGDSAGNTDRDAAAELLAGFAVEHEGRQPSDVQELARWMIRHKRLTRYQAQQLVASQPADLRIGHFLIRQPLAAPPFVGWFSAVAEDGSPVLLLRHPAAIDAAARQQVEAHAAIRSPHLQTIEPPLVLASTTLYVSRLPSGATAAQAIPRGGFSTARAARIGRQLCDAVATLHAHGLPANIVDATRVWIAKTGETILLRDPLSRPIAGARSPNDSGRGWFAQPPVDNLFLAPERQFDGRGPDASTDLYALGCMLFFLRFGHPPFPGATRAEVAEQHVKQFPAAIRSALATPDSAEPLLRVIGHAIAKNRDARFTNADQMRRALAAVEAAAVGGELSPSTPKTRPSSQPAPTQEATAAATGLAAAEIDPASPPTVASHQSAASPSRPTPTPAAPEPPAAQLPPANLPAAKLPPLERRRRRKKNLAAPLILGGLGVLVMFLLILLLAGPRGGETARSASRVAPPLPPQVDQRASGTSNAPSPTTTTRPADVAVRLVDDPGLLWAAPPSLGTAPDLSLLPPGAAMIVSFRPHRLASTPAGQHLGEALAPELSEAMQILQGRVGVPLDDVDRLTMAIEGMGGGSVGAALSISLTTPVATERLLEAWQASEAETAQGHRVYTKEAPNADVYYIPPSAGPETKRFAVGSAEQIARVAEIEGGPLPLPQNLAQLWQEIGGESDLAVLVHPNFLFADGRQMLQQYAPAAIDPLRELLIPDAAALALRMDLDPQWYAELRLAPGGGTHPAKLAKDVRDAVAELPTTAEQFLLVALPEPSWRALALRLPAMLRAVDAATRSGVVDSTATLNLYLPPEAAPNVLLASWLALNTRTPLDSRAADDAGLATRPSDGGGPQTVDQLLDRPLSIRFDQESLESALETIRDQFNASLPSGSPQLEIILMGGDLQLAGITQNQQIRGFEHRDQPLRKVLDDVVRRANPDQTVTKLSQDAQKLVWAVGPAPDDPDRRVILITTRDQAVAKYELPSQFSE